MKLLRKHTRLLLRLVQRTGWQEIGPKDEESAYALLFMGMISLRSDPRRLVMMGRVRNAGRRRVGTGV